jgi:protein-S-isoprenylcysteine O-methyltransferase Ste14
MAADHGHQLTDGSEQHVEHERPEDWGWHHEFSKGRQIMGWFSVLVLGLFLTTTHYNMAGSVGILLTMLALAGGLIWDRQRRKTQWRR